MAKGEILALTLAEGVEITEGVEVVPGSAFVEIVDETNWDGVEKEVSYNVSADVPDARKLQWTFSRNVDANDNLQLSYQIKMSETHVTVTTSIAPAAGTYTLLGVG